MAIAPTSLAASINTTDATSFTTASVATSSHYNELFTVVVYSVAGTDPNIPTFTQQRGLSLTQVTTFVNSTDHARITLFRACIASGGSSGSFTIDFAGQTQTIAAWDIVSWTGTGATAANNGSDGIGQTVSTVNSGSSTSLSMSTGALQSGSATYGAFAHGANEGLNAGSGYTTLCANQSAGTPATGFRDEYKIAGSTTIDMSWTTNQHPRAGAGCEIKIASTADTRFVGAIPI